MIRISCLFLISPLIRCVINSLDTEGKMTNEPTLSQKLTSFDCVYCSGYFVPEPHLVTALSLLFNRVYLLNNLEYVLLNAEELTSTSPADVPKDQIKGGEQPLTKKWPVVHEFVIQDARDEPTGNPLLELPEHQNQAAALYLKQTNDFVCRYGQLFPDVFVSSLLPKGRPEWQAVVWEDKEDAKQPIKVDSLGAKLHYSLGGADELNAFLDAGVLPLAGPYHPSRALPAGNTESARSLAALLALRSMELVFPATKETDAETILEARYRLRDHLPPFWSAMLRLSSELQSRLTPEVGTSEVERETQDLVDRIVRPSLTDLVLKLDKERRNWFYKILASVRSGLIVVAGKPPLTKAELVSAALSLGSQVAVDLAKHFQDVASISEAGLTYLIKVHEEFGKND